jgi:hypothetical protein
MEGNIRQGMSAEEARAEFEADMHAETYADRWQMYAEAGWQAAADAMEAGAREVSGLNQAQAELDAAWSSGDAGRIEAAETAVTQAGARFGQALADAWEPGREEPEAGQEAEMG